MSLGWVCIAKERGSKLKQYLPHTEVYDHPLRHTQNVVVTENRMIRKIGSMSKTSSTASSTLSVNALTLDGSDPLTHFAEMDNADPLSKIVIENKERKIDSMPDETFEKQVFNLWKNRRSVILKKYTTAEKLSIATSFIAEGEIIKSQPRLSEKVKSRLEQLDNFDNDSVHKMINLTQYEYQLKIDQLKEELIQAWNTDQRVRALKIAIQCSQLLTDTSVLQFYPSQFVLITDILDIFGKLVYERLWLKAKSEYDDKNKKLSPEKFTADIIPDSVKETCQNWFYKIASIRELLPRLYLEIALLKSYNFLIISSDLSKILSRLTHTIRGIGDPLVSVYVRSYLCRVGATVTVDLDYITENLNDFLFIYNTIVFGGIRANLSNQRIDIDGYIQLFTPALSFIMETISTQASDVLLEEIFSKCQARKNNGLLLQCILSTFKPSFISARANKFINILTGNQGENTLKSLLLRLLGISVCRHSPEIDQRLSILNGAWKSINTITHLNEYIQCIEPWAEYITLHFGVRESNILLGEILLRLNQSRSIENLYSETELILNKLVNNSNDLEALITSENFLPMLDVIQKESIRVDICKNIMNVYKLKTYFNEEYSCSDPVVTNSFKYVCKILSDGLSSVSVDDEKRHVSQLIMHFIEHVDYRGEFERQLIFYVEARATFSNLDSVLETLVHCVNLLAINERHTKNGQHSKKSIAFVKACAAYCFITIPSIASITSRLSLYLLSGQVAFQNGCVSQADSFFEAIINLLNESSKLSESDNSYSHFNESFIVSFISNLLSTLIIVPDSPDRGVLYLTRCLLDFIKNCNLNNESYNKAVIYFQVLDMLITSVRDVYPYHVSNLVSNDELYGSDPKFIAEINSLCSQVVDYILVQLKELGESNRPVEQSTLSLELFHRISLNSNICSEKMFSLAVNLWNLSMKNAKLIDKNLPGSILIAVERYKRSITDNELRIAFEELTTKMKIKM